MGRLMTRSTTAEEANVALVGFVKGYGGASELQSRVEVDETCKSFGDESFRSVGDVLVWWGGREEDNGELSEP